MVQTPSINAFDTKKLDAMESELKQLNNLTPSEIIARMNQLYEKYSSEYQNDKEKMSTELRTKYEELLAAMKRDVAEIQTKINSPEKNADIRMQTLDALRNFQSAATTVTTMQPVEKPAEPIAVEKDTPKPIEVIPIDAETSKFLKNFQTEAAEAFKKEILGENGKPNYLSFRKGLEFVADLQNLNTIDTKKFSWFDDMEKEKIGPQMTAVRGILGAIFVEALFSVGYTIAFNGDGTVNMRAKSGITDVNEKMNEINTAIKRNPGLSETLKMGLLYADGDLLKYMQSVATSDGNNITPDLQKPEEFIKYLHNRDKSQSTVAGDAIKNSADFFKGMNLSAQMKAANHIPEIWSTLSVVMNDPNVLSEIERAAKEVAEKQRGIYNAPSIEPMGRMGALAQGAWASIGNEWQTKSIDQSIVEHGAIIGGVEQAVFMVGRWAVSLSKSPAALWVAIFVFFYSWFGLKNGFFKSLAYTATGLGVMGGLDYWQGKYDGNDRMGNAPIQYTPAPVPKADPNAIRQQREQDFGVDGARKAAEILDGTIASANNNNVLLYLWGDKNVDLTPEQKALLDIKENADIVRKEIENNRKKMVDRIGTLSNADNADAIKEMQERLLATLTVEELKNLANSSDVDLQKWANSEITNLEQAVTQAAKDGTISPEEKSAWDQAIAWLKAAAVKWGLLLLGTAIVWKGSKYLLISIGKAIGGKIWEAIVNRVQKASIRNAVNNQFGKTTANVPNGNSDTPNDTPNPIPDKTGKWLAQYEQEVNNALLEEDRLAKKTRWIVFAGKESKQHAENAAKLQEERNKIEKFNSNRPFANEAARKDMNTKYDTLTEQIADTNRKISRLSNPTLDEYLELSNPEETLVSLNNKLANLNNQLADLNASMSSEMSILLNGNSYNITALQAREFESALKTLREFDGRTIYEYTSTGTQVSKISADEMARLNDAIADVNKIRSEVAASRNLTYAHVNINDLLENIAAKRGANRAARFALNALF